MILKYEGTETCFAEKLALFLYSTGVHSLQGRKLGLMSILHKGETWSYFYILQERWKVLSRFHREECSHISVFHRGTAWSYIIPHREDTYSYVYIPHGSSLVLFVYPKGDIFGPIYILCKFSI